MTTELRDNNEINAFGKNSIIFNVKSPAKFVFAVDGKVVKIIQESWYRRLTRYLKSN